MRGKTENIHNTIFTQFTTFLSIMILYGQSNGTNSTVIKQYQ